MTTRVFYASGINGKEVRADGKGGTLARGYYIKIEVSSYGGKRGGTFGPFKTKTEANIRAWGTSREPLD
jgi:hypothetical protein